jgi:hypothetical protein
MKYYLSIIFALFLLVSCDDGNLITESFDLQLVTDINKCTSSNTLYKIKSNEALILNADESNFQNVETPVNTPKIVANGTGISILYRKYSDVVALNSICSSPAPATPVVLEEWNVIGGNMVIETKKVFDTNGIDVIAYNHYIVFKNVTFSYNGKQIAYDSYVFGNYRTNVIRLPFEFASASMLKCPTNNLLFKYNNTEVLLFDIDRTTLLANAATTIGSPRTALINTTNNRVIYRVYTGNLSQDYFCSSILPTTPSVTEEWVAENGVTAVSGIIKVETVAQATTPVSYKHTITLFKTTFKKGTSSYSLPDNYIFGTIVTE